MGYETRKLLPQETAERYYWIRQRYRQVPRIDQPMTFMEMVCRDHLYTCFLDLRAIGGPAAGPDGVRMTDISPGEFSRIVPELSRRLRTGEYRPSPARIQPRPKGDGTFRDLRIGNACTRVVGKALHRAISPLVDTVFVDESWGFRTNRNTCKMLASIKTTIERTDRWVLARADVRRAFDSVRIDDVMESHRTVLSQTSFGDLPDPDKQQYLSLIKVMLQGGETDRAKGIDQGSPYSPVALNIFLHCIHDVPFRRDVAFPFGRYADDLAYVCRTVPEGRKVLRQLRTRLDQYNLEVKDDAEIIDLSNGDTCPLLGYALRKVDDEVRLRVHEESRRELESMLEECHKTKTPHRSARAIVRGWVESMGPAFVKGEDHVSDILVTVASLGFREASSPRELRGWWQDAYERWERLCADCRRYYGVCQGEEDGGLRRTSFPDELSPRPDSLHDRESGCFSPP